MSAASAVEWLRRAGGPAPAVSVVVPTYQRRDALRRLLGALARQDAGACPFEAVVVADGSTDGTRELLAGYAAPYPLAAAWKPNGGRAAACNAGILAARGALVVLLDDDMAPAPGLLAAHASAHARAEARGERLAVLGAAPAAPAAGAPPAAAYLAAKFNEHLAKLAEPGRPIRLGEFYSGHCSIRRDVLVAVGLFDEAFRAYGNEDLELYVRLAAAGVRAVYAPDAVAEQGFDKGAGQLARDSEAEGRTAVLLARKHPAVRAELRLGQMERQRAARRLLLGAAVRLSGAVPAVADGAAAAFARLGAPRRGHRSRWYAFARDYFYLLGARAAERELRDGGRG